STRPLRQRGGRRCGVGLFPRGQGRRRLVARIELLSAGIPQASAHPPDDEAVDEPRRAAREDADAILRLPGRAWPMADGILDHFRPQPRAIGWDEAVHTAVLERDLPRQL